MTGKDTQRQEQESFRLGLNRRGRKQQLRTQRRQKEQQQQQQQQRHGGSKRREMAGLCSGLESLNTTYRTIQPGDIMYPFSGIMFEMSTTSSESNNANYQIRILTLEINVLAAAATEFKNTSVRVYTFPGSYVNLQQNASAWTLIADTNQLVVAPEGSQGLIIPVADFTPVSLPTTPGRRVSFYIAFDAPIVMYNAYALTRQGEPFLETDALTLYAGTGLNDTQQQQDFSNQNASTVVSPLFAGVIHYARTAKCDSVLHYDYPEFRFVLTISSDPQILQLVSDSIKQQINELLQTNGSELQRMALSHSLKLIDEPQSTINDPSSSNTTTISNSNGLSGNDNDPARTPITAVSTKALAYTGKCPSSSWAPSCPTTYLSVTVPFSHWTSLKSQDFLAELYRYPQVMTVALQDYLNEQLQPSNTIKVLYIGNEAAKATFSLQLSGHAAGGSTQTGTTLDAVTVNYLQVMTRSFLANAVNDGGYTTVLQVQVTNQEMMPPPPPSPSRKQRYLQSTTTRAAEAQVPLLQIQGMVTGTHPGAFGTTDFVQTIRDGWTMLASSSSSLSSQGDSRQAYVNKLQHGDARPYELDRAATTNGNSDPATWFQTYVTGFQLLSLVAAPSPVILPNDASSDNDDSKHDQMKRIFLYVGVALLAVLLLVGLILWIRWCRREKQEEKDVQEYRQEMRDARRQKRRAKEEEAKKKNPNKKGKQQEQPTSSPDRARSAPDTTPATTQNKPGGSGPNDGPSRNRNSRDTDRVTPQRSKSFDDTTTTDTKRSPPNRTKSYDTGRTSQEYPQVSVKYAKERIVPLEKLRPQQQQQQGTIQK